MFKTKNKVIKQEKTKIQNKDKKNANINKAYALLN